MLGLSDSCTSPNSKRRSPRTIRAVSAGQVVVPRQLSRTAVRPALSHREKQALALLANGFTNRQIAARLFLAESTVKTHLTSVFGKLGVHSRSEAAELVLDPDQKLGLGDRRARARPRRGRPRGSGELEVTSVPLTRLDNGDPDLLEELLEQWKGSRGTAAFTGGAEVERFETEFAAYCDAAFAVGVASGTDALALAMRALGIGPGDEVILPANSFIATAEAVSLVGAAPRFVDVDPETHLLTADGRAGDRPEDQGRHPGSPLRADRRDEAAALAGASQEARGRRRRLPGARGEVPRPPGRDRSADARLLQLLPRQEPRRLGRRWRGRDERSARSPIGFGSFGRMASDPATTTASAGRRPGSTRFRRLSCE